MYGGFATTAWNFVREHLPQRRAHIGARERRPRFSCTASNRVELQRGLLLVALHLLEPIRPVHMRMELRGLGQRCATPASSRRRHDQPRPRQRAGVVVQIDADDPIERVRHDLARDPTPGASPPSPPRAA